MRIVTVVSQRCSLIANWMMIDEEINKDDFERSFNLKLENRRRRKHL
jgi:hypothetical protein